MTTTNLVSASSRPAVVSRAVCAKGGRAGRYRVVMMMLDLVMGNGLLV